MTTDKQTNCPSCGGTDLRDDKTKEDKIIVIEIIVCNSCGDWWRK